MDRPVLSDLMARKVHRVPMEIPDLRDLTAIQEVPVQTDPLAQQDQTDCLVPAAQPDPPVHLDHLALLEELGRPDHKDLLGQ